MPIDPKNIPPVVGMRRVAPGWFETLGMRLIAGRFLNAADISSGAHPVVISEGGARLYFGDADPIGRRIYPDIGEQNPRWYTIVGVVSDVPTFSLTEGEHVPALYFPLLDLPTGPSIMTMSYVLRTSVPPLSVLPAARRAVAAVEPDLPLAQARTLEQILAEASAQGTFTMMLILVAASVALALGVVGIYGVVSYAVSRRTAEIGVRMALGAQRAEIARMVMRQGTLVAVTGIVFGIAAAAAASRLLRNLLFQVSPVDAVTYAAVSAIVLFVVLAACAIPAMRAAKLDPVRALRNEA